MYRLVVYVPQELHKKLKIKCATSGTNVSAWFRKKAKEELGQEVKNEQPIENTNNDVCALPLCENRASEIVDGEPRWEKHTGDMYGQ